MCRTTIVCGPTGVGKTTHSIAVADGTNAIRFSIDPWMQTLFAKDMTSLDFAWMMERVGRCQDQIWSVGEQVLARGGSVMLDLGFTARAQRQVSVERAAAFGVPVDIHYLDAPSDVRRRQGLLGAGFASGARSRQRVFVRTARSANALSRPVPCGPGCRSER